MTDKYIEFLNRLEEKESELLAWGVVDGGFTEEELYEEAEQFVSTCDATIDPEELCEELLDRRLLFEMHINGKELFRTRSAEAVRLFSRLRQWFPGRDWRTSPTLVADYRFALRPRTYPRRHLLPATVVRNLVGSVQLTALQRQVLDTVLTSAERGRPLELADFQMRASVRMLKDLEATHSRGMIVGAGTGTGKTLAFYIPAFVHVAKLMSKDEHWTKVIAIYPRNELLKDQFSETCTEIRRLSRLLSRHLGRTITIGAFFGPTPLEPEVDKVSDKKEWEANSVGYICPYLRCPDPNCGGNLVWRRQDIEDKVERLFCTKRRCSVVVTGEEVLLTRRRMQETPPDFLFTTTEMLNRQMSSSRYGHVFGVRARKAPQVMLLDEVHTYSGSHGAQAALLLRRWRHAVGSKIHFTGLSATLRNASDFFSSLVGINPASIEEITPGDNLEEHGKEYLLALRGDPVSATSLLSTSIQTAMLLRRVLDPPDNDPGEGTYGRRVFVFTDDLDVTNRLFHNMLDAEGRDSWGRPVNGKIPLASLRASGTGDAARRLAEGQSWLLSERVGHSLTPADRLVVGRTSSQDVGVDSRSDVIVATASLEVGFNDPEVGAVMQHKAPRDMAAFLQRKGRAGRRRGMRPWTVVVLSDYGRDRLAYQGYDLLFSPILDSKTLPVSNRYILRMQAVFAFMDWVAFKMPRNLPRGSVWNDFSGPIDVDKPWGPAMRSRQLWEEQLIRNVLQSDTLRGELEYYLARALRISRDEVQVLFWESPRPLITGVLPTLLRRLESSWAKFPAAPDWKKEDYKIPFAPLPDFVPANLFSDLNLPEVTVITPPQTRGAEPDSNLMPIVQAMTSFAPGRVTRRFGIQHAYASHWVAPNNLEDGEQSLSVDRFAEEYEPLDTFQMWEGDKTVAIHCVRPFVIKPVLPPKHVRITSNARMNWRTQIVPFSEPLEFDLPAFSAWKDIVQELRFFTHNNMAHVEVRRFALGSEAAIRFDDGSELETTIQFTQGEHGEAIAVGFSQDVDGIVFRYHLPQDLRISPDDTNQPKIRALRTAYFKHRVLTDPSLSIYANEFQRDWLYQVFLSTLTARAITESSTLEQANVVLSDGRLGAEMERVLETIFQALPVEELDGAVDGEEGVDDVVRQPLHNALRDLCHQSEVAETLTALAQVLWSDADEGWNELGAERFRAALGGALLQACYQSCQDTQAGNLYLDLDPGPRPPHSEPTSPGVQEIWITEGTIGGGGVIEEILRKYASDPRKFFSLVESALDPSDFEVVDAELTLVLELAACDAEVASALAACRSSRGHDELRRATDQLKAILSAKSVLVTHAVFSAINARILRPGSSPESDQRLRELITTWRALEEELGIEIDARVFAYTASSSDSLRDALSHVDSIHHYDQQWRFQVIYSLLWPRGNYIRSRSLSSYHPFSRLPEGDREVLLDCLRRREVNVSLIDPSWRDKVTSALSEGGVVNLSAPATMGSELKRAALDLVAIPLEIGYMHLYPRADRVQKGSEFVSLTISLEEAVQ